MPKLPTAEDLGERPTPRPAGGIAQYQPVNEGPLGAELRQAGAEVEHGGNVLGAAAVQMEKAMKVEQERVDTTRAEEAFTQLRQKQMELQFGDQGFAKATGSAAVTTPLFNNYTSQYKDAARDISESLGNPQQQEKFQQRADVAFIQFQHGILTHVQQESKVYAKQVYTGTIATETQAAAANWNDPNAMGLSMARIDAAVDHYAEVEHLPAEIVQAMRLEDHGKVHAGVVSQMLAAGNFKSAEDYYDKYREDIPAAVGKEIGHAVREGTQKQLVADYNGNFLASRDNVKGLDALERKVTADPTLDDTRKNTLVGRIQSRAEVLRNQAMRYQMQQERQIERGISAINAVTLSGFEPTVEQMTPLINAAKGTALEPQVRNMVAVADATRKFRLMDPQGQEAYLTRFEAEARKDPAKFDVTMLGKLRNIQDAQAKSVKDDPVSFAVRQGFIDPQVPAAAPLDLRDPSKIGPQLSARFELARAVASRYSVPVKPLTHEETDLLKSALSKSTATDKAGYFAGLSKATGQDFDGYKAVMAQIAQDDPVTAIAGVYAGRGYSTGQLGLTSNPGEARAVSTLILKGQEILHPKGKDDGQPAHGKLWPMPPEDKMAPDFANAAGKALAGMGKAYTGYYQTAQAIYAARSAEAGDASGVLDSGRWQESIKMATGGIERINGKEIVMPYGFGRGDFKDALNTRLQGLAAGGTLAPGVSLSTLGNLPLESVGDGRYVMRAGDGILVDKANKPVVLDFNHLPDNFGQRPKAPATTPSNVAPGDTAGGAASSLPAPARAPRADKTSEADTGQTKSERRWAGMIDRLLTSIVGDASAAEPRRFIAGQEQNAADAASNHGALKEKDAANKPQPAGYVGASSANTAKRDQLVKMLMDARQLSKKAAEAQADMMIKARGGN